MRPTAMTYKKAESQMPYSKSRLRLRKIADISCASCSIAQKRVRESLPHQPQSLFLDLVSLSSGPFLKFSKINIFKPKVCDFPEGAPKCPFTVDSQLEELQCFDGSESIVRFAVQL